jgi:2-polyprenyl-3-methyl-5-hydroxy-6-metoxy-1,4-benzoquinol methylase
MWEINKTHIKLKINNSYYFEDTLDHWQNGILRLLNLNDKEAKAWISFIIRGNKNWLEMSYEEKYFRLIKATRNYFNLKESVQPKKYPSFKVLGSKINMIYGEINFKNNRALIAGNNFVKHAVLLTNDGKKVSPLKYEENYFEGKIDKLGYGDYLKQQQWRIEKSTRMLKLIRMAYPKKNLTLLDIGAGYGFFRKSADLMGIKHQGLEISKFANKMTKKLFNFSNIEGDINNISPNKKFDVITCLDVIEHIKDISKFMIQVKSHLKKGGILVIRTPNLESFEYKCLLNNFYSFKYEHLNYFSPRSLSMFLLENNLNPIFINTTSHLFGGFKDFYIENLNSNLEGSDIFMVGKHE